MKDAPEVTTQILIDAGLNAFGLELFCESIAGKTDVKTFNPISFRYRGVKVTMEPDPASHPLTPSAPATETRK